MGFKVTNKLHAICLFLSFLIFGVLYGFVDNNMASACVSDVVNYPTSNRFLNLLLILISLVYAMALFHEVIHALMYRFFGGRAKIGFKLIFAYTQETTRLAISSYKFVAILLSPLLVISSVAFLMNNWVGNLLFFFNLIGSTGDMIMAIVVMMYGRKGKIVDNPNGFDVV